MTISGRVHQEFFKTVHDPQLNQQPNQTQQLVRIPPTKRPRAASTASSSASASNVNSSVSSRWWTAEEHDRFLQAIERFPQGPWKSIAAFVGNKTARQVMSHGQKYRQKIARRRRGLQLSRPRRRKAAQRIAVAATATSTRTDWNSDASKQTLDGRQESASNQHSSHERMGLCCPESPTDISVVLGGFYGRQWPAESVAPEFHTLRHPLSVPPVDDRGICQESDYPYNNEFVHYFHFPVPSTSVDDPVVGEDAGHCIDWLHQQDDAPMLHELLECLEDLLSNDFSIPTVL